MRKNNANKKSKRPVDGDLTQQRLKVFPRNISPTFLAITLVVLAILFIPTGTTLLSQAKNIYEQKITYDDGTSSSDCYISSSNQGRVCQVSFVLSEDVDGPIYLYYQLENFFQNHRRYYQSLSRGQLSGEVLKESDVSLTCTPLYKNGSNLLNPCGLIANSFFNDVIALNSSATTVPGVYLDETNIALRSDRTSVYKQVSGFKSVEVNSTSVTCSEVSLPSTCKYYRDPSTGQQFLFSYPDDTTTQYLYETYPNQISPIDGVTNEHFMVWMKPEMLPTFRKLYGSVNGSFSAGDVLSFTVTANYEVGSFDATKTLVLSTLGLYGGKNIFLGQLFITVGSFALFYGVVLLGKEQWLLRKKQTA